MKYVLFQSFACLIFFAGCSTPNILYPSRSINHQSACSPNSDEKQFLDNMSALNKIQIWKGYPSGYLFGIIDIDAQSAGYIRIPSAGTPMIDGMEKCPSYIDLLMFKNKDVIGSDPNFFPHCTQNTSDVCQDYPQLNKIFDVTKKPVSLEVIDRARMTQTFKLILNSDHVYTVAQLSIYNSAHEMFHDYQDDFFSSYAENRPDCEVADWPQLMAKEREWFLKNVDKIYLEQDVQKLKTLAKLIPRNKLSKIYAKCIENYSYHERHEGVAHYAGNMSMLAAKVITMEQIVSIDTLYLKANSKDFSMINIYASGGIITYLISKIAPIGYDWQAKIEKGSSPFEVLTELTAK